MLWPLLAAIGGVGGVPVLRLLQRSTGFEADTGLPIPGNLYAHPAGGLVRGSGGSLPAGGPAPLPAGPRGPAPLSRRLLRGFPGLLTPAVMGLFLLAASGVLDLLVGFSGASALTGSGETVTVL